MRYIFVLKRIYIFIIAIASFAEANAQYDPSFSHYWELEPSFNPASVGKEKLVNAAGAYALSMAGFENNPRTMYVGADMPFYFAKHFHGVGLQFMNDQIGLFYHKRFSAQYAFQQKLFGGVLAVGVNIGMLNEKFDGSKVVLPDNDSDPAIDKSEISGTGLDLGAALYYTRKSWYAGLSVLHFNGPSIELGERQNFKIDPTFYFTAGYNIKLRNPFFTIHPTLLARTDFAAYRVDVTLRLRYQREKKMLYGGVAYSPTNSVTALIGGNFHGIRLGYSFEIYTSGIGFRNGSHELSIGYQHEIDFQKRGRNRHKSVRLL